MEQETCHESGKKIGPAGPILATKSGPTGPKMTPKICPINPKLVRAHKHLEHVEISEEGDAKSGNIVED